MQLASTGVMATPACNPSQACKKMSLNCALRMQQPDLRVGRHCIASAHRGSRGAALLYSEVRIEGMLGWCLRLQGNGAGPPDMR